MLPEVALLGDLKIEEVFAYYDFPRLFSCVDSKGRFYLVISVEDLDDGWVWLYAPMSRERLEKIRWGKIALREAFLQAEGGIVYQVTIPTVDSLPSKMKEVSSSQVPDDWLPEGGKRLESLSNRFGQRGTASVSLPTEHESQSGLSVPPLNSSFVSLVTGVPYYTAGTSSGLNSRFGAGINTSGVGAVYAQNLVRILPSNFTQDLKGPFINLPEGIQKVGAFKIMLTQSAGEALSSSILVQNLEGVNLSINNVISPIGFVNLLTDEGFYIGSSSSYVFSNPNEEKMEEFAVTKPLAKVA